MTEVQSSGTEQLLASLAMGKVETCPFHQEEVESLKQEIIQSALDYGIVPGVRTDVPIDYRFLQLFLKLSDDPETGLGDYSQGGRVGRAPGCPGYQHSTIRSASGALLAHDYLEQVAEQGSVWRFESQVLDVMHNQATRGQVLVFSELEAKQRFPDLVIASLGAQRKEEPGGIVTARVLFDGTHGLCVNSRTRLRDQERAPVAADLKRAMREKANMDEMTFALSADVAEAHRQVPVHPDDWHFLCCQVVPGAEVFVNTVGTFGITSASCYWSRV